MKEKENLTAKQENDKHTKPCPFNKAVSCVQFPEKEEDKCGCDPCNDCEIKEKAETAIKK